jgi:hypothetical protein
MVVAICSIITLIGLWTVLRKYFTGITTIATLLLLVFGTNVYLIIVFSEAIQAGILLALMVLVLWMTQRWHEKPGWIEAIVGGLAMGTLVFIKAAGFASIFLFLFWNAYNRETFIKKWKDLIEHADQVLTILVLFSGGVAMRLYLPRAFEGSLFNDYVAGTRAFYFLAPNLYLVLFSIKNGWIIYTPLVLASLPGFYILAERNKPIFYPVFLYSLFFLLFVASALNAPEPNNYGQARMTEIFGVLFIPITYFINWIIEGRWRRKTAFGLILAALIGLNLFQIWQFRNKILNPWFTTPDYYSAVFLKTHTTSADRQLMDFYNMDPGSYLSNTKDFNITILAFHDYENDPGGYGGHIQEQYSKNGKASFRLDTAFQFVPTYVVQLKKLPENFPLGVRATVQVFLPSTPVPGDIGSLIISQRHKGILHHYRAFILHGIDYQAGKWHEIHLDYVLTRPFDPEDELICHLWYTGKESLYADDLKVELFEPKDK